MGRPDKPFGYNMGQHIHNALVALEGVQDDIEHTLKTHPTNPVVWVKCIGRILGGIRTAIKELGKAKKIFEDNKIWGGNGDADENST